LGLELDAAATHYLAKEGYDPQFGARPLKRAIQQLLLDPLAMKLLDGEINKTLPIPTTRRELVGRQIS
jgi:ATP-dependent Clp protease ATP-binding subunit ClpB